VSFLVIDNDVHSPINTVEYYEKYIGEDEENAVILDEIFLCGPPLARTCLDSSKA
jgi:hypothetical protein